MQFAPRAINFAYYAGIMPPGCGWAAETKKVLKVCQTLSARALILQAITPCAEKVVWFTRLATVYII